MTAPAGRRDVTVLSVDAVRGDDTIMRLLAAARVVAGGRRHLETVRHLLPPVTRTVPLVGDLSEAFDAIETAAGPVVVLASGDPGFFGIVGALSERVGSERLEVIPGPSSIARVCARVGVAWDDAVVVSAHGREPSVAVAACRAAPKVAVLTAPDFTPVDLAVALYGQPRRLVVAERLGGPDERVTVGTPAEVAAGTFTDPNVVLCLADPPPARRRSLLWPVRSTADAWALPERAFDHRDGMITKAEVRALALAWLGPGIGDLIWDVGAGSGAVGVEAARLGAAVVAVEPDPQQCARIRNNADRHGVDVEVVTGRAPQALTDLPDPDAVFVGGGGLPAVEAAVRRVRRTVVVVLATVERVTPVRGALTAGGLAVEATMLAASRLEPLADGHRLDAQNPVFVLRGVRP